MPFGATLFPTRLVVQRRGCVGGLGSSSRRSTGHACHADTGCQSHPLHRIQASMPRPHRSFEAPTICSSRSPHDEEHHGRPSYTPNIMLIRQRALRHARGSWHAIKLEGSRCYRDVRCDRRARHPTERPSRCTAASSPTHFIRHGATQRWTHVSIASIYDTFSPKSMSVIDDTVREAMNLPRAAWAWRVLDADRCTACSSGQIFVQRA